MSLWPWGGSCTSCQVTENLLPSSQHFRGSLAQRSIAHPSCTRLLLSWLFYRQPLTELNVQASYKAFLNSILNLWLLFSWPACSLHLPGSSWDWNESRLCICFHSSKAETGICQETIKQHNTICCGSIFLPETKVFIFCAHGTGFYQYKCTRPSRQLVERVLMHTLCSTLTHTHENHVSLCSFQATEIGCMGSSGMWDLWHIEPPGDCC